MKLGNKSKTMTVWVEGTCRDWSNFQSKDVGQLSAATVFMQFAGSLARVFTTLAQVPDTIILLGFAIGVLLNGTLMAQVLLFGSKPTAVKKKN